MGRPARILEVLASGLFLALLAPLFAAVIFTINVVVWPEGGANQLDASFMSLALLFLGVASASFFLGALPAFAAGLVLPMLRQRLASLPAALATGCVAVAVYLATFGRHLLGFPVQLLSVLPIAVAAFVGAATAAYLYTRRS